MWFRHRLRRLQSRLRHLSLYLKTLSNANVIERQTDLSQCRRPVLLLYGFGATRRSVSILETRLRQDGFDVFSINLGGFLELFNTDPIDKTAKKVAKKIEDLCDRYALPKISVIGYSKGGLIGRYYVSCLGGTKRVHTLITLASPHQGNPWALFSLVVGLGMVSKGLRQLLPKTPFLKKLNRLPHPEGIYMVSISSEKDRQCPPKYCQLPFTENGKSIHNVILPSLHHSDFVIKQRAYQEIVKHLEAGASFANEPQSPPTSEGYSSSNRSITGEGQRR